MPAHLPPIASEALTWRFSRASGPGGQHVNTSSTRVELECDLAAAGYPPALTQRMVAALGPVVRVTVADTRSQHRNRELAEARLHTLLEKAAAVPRTRRPTRPGKGAVERRLAAKQRRAGRKADRSWRPDE
ncbi:MAG: alternative ribosome rescue aminoacyl-tRNA hydrolase ArfB [Ilumatobacteraceae bacterium]|nr:aminoacyl-tRNA hydrolase [Ilumatobacter sp.]MCB0985791.1 aminoacyl-tRNA hydrolase [Ilumatobacter sp.]